MIAFIAFPFGPIYIYRKSACDNNYTKDGAIGEDDAMKERTDNGTADADEDLLYDKNADDEVQYYYDYADYVNIQQLYSNGIL